MDGTEPLLCSTDLKEDVISKEVFNRELALCKKLSTEKGGGCGWGKCNDCGVIALLYKLHKGVLLEGEELKQKKEEIFRKII